MSTALDKLFALVARLSSFIILVILIAVFAILFKEALPAIQAFGIKFITNTRWAPNMDIFGGLPAIYGSVMSTLIAMLLATPVAMGVAIFLTEIAPKFLKGPVGTAIEMLAAIPSIIYGMWGLFFFAPIIRDYVGGNGLGLLTAGIVLAIMVLPFMAAITRDAMNTTPDVLKESAYALGATKFDVIKDVVFPYAKAGILGSIILALGRAVGETMAVTFVMGNAHKIPKHIYDPATSIPVTLANEFTEADSDLYYASLFYLALILFVMSFVFIAAAKFYFFRKIRSAK